MSSYYWSAMAPADATSSNSPIRSPRRIAALTLSDESTICRRLSGRPTPVWLTARRGGETFALESLASRSPILAYDGPAARFAKLDQTAIAPLADPVTLARLTVEWLRGQLRFPTGYSSLVASFSPEAVAARAATVYTA